MNAARRVRTRQAAVAASRRVYRADEASAMAEARRAGRCVCGAGKDPDEAFCGTCLAAVPLGLRGGVASDWDAHAKAVEYLRGCGRVR